MTRATRLLGFILVAAGILPLLYAVGLLVWQAVMWLKTGTWIALPTRLLVDPSLLHGGQLASIAPFIPNVDWAWANHPRGLILLNKLLGVLLDRVHLALVVAAAGYAVLKAGATIVARQAEIIEGQEQQRSDRRRRIARYANR